MIIYKYHIEKPDLYTILEIINKYVNKLQKDFESRNASLLFKNGLTEYDIKVMRVDLHRINNIEILESYLTFLGMMYTINIPRLTIRVKTSLNQMTKSQYLEMEKPMIEWLFLKKNIDHHI